MEVFYSHSRVNLKPGQTYRNPRLFAGIVPGATSVIIEGDWPNVADAYAKAGIPVDGQLATPPAPAPFELPPHDASAVVIPDGWRDLPWNAVEVGGLSLRALGAAVRGAPVVSKADAAEAIEAELAKRGQG